MAEVVETPVVPEAPVTPVEEAVENLEAAPVEEVPKVVEEELPKEVPQTEEDKRFATKFAALSRKEKAIRESEKRLNTRMKELDAKLAASEASKPAPVVEEALDRRIRKDPFNTLKSLGVDYETLTQIALNNGKLTPELQMQLMKEELESKYTSQLDEVNKKIAAREQKEEESRVANLVNEFKGKISTQISSAAEDFELVAAEGQDGVEAVYEIIDAYYQETGEVLDIKEAVEAAEEELLEQAKKRIGLAKIKKLMGASEIKTQEPKPQAPIAPVKKTSTTLSNSATQVQPTTGQFLSDEESKRQAAKLIKFDA